MGHIFPIIDCDYVFVKGVTQLRWSEPVAISGSRPTGNCRWDHCLLGKFLPVLETFKIEASQTILNKVPPVIKRSVNTCLFSKSISNQNSSKQGQNSKEIQRYNVPYPADLLIHLLWRDIQDQLTLVCGSSHLCAWRYIRKQQFALTIHVYHTLRLVKLGTEDKRFTFCKDYRQR